MRRTSLLLRTGTALVTALVLVTVATAALAATTGKITGSVREKGKAALPGVTVIVDGTRLGAIADDQGRYTILNVPAGAYTVRGRLIGYADYVLTNVQVRPDFTTEANLEMLTDAIQQEPVIVESTRPLIQKDATGTTRFLSGEDIKNLPTRGYRDAASLQTGVVNFQRNIDRESQNTPTLIVRGGRPNEVAYYVDGFSQQDPLTGNSTTNISNNSVEEVVVMTGGFNAEYGKVSSGIINVITRDGGAKYFGAVETVTDAPAGDWIGSKRYDYNIYDVSLGGPIVPRSEKANFYFSGERRWQGDRTPRFFPAGLIAAARDGIDLGAKAPNSALTGDDLVAGRLPNNSLSGWTWQGKVTWRPTDRVNVKVGTLGSRDDWREFLQSYIFNAEHMPRYQDKNRSGFVTLNQNLSNTSFYSASINYFETERRRGDGVFFDDVRAYAGVNPTFDTDLPYFRPPGYVFDDYLHRKSSYWGVKGDLTSQLNRYHQLKGGAELQLHKLRFYNAFFPRRIFDSTGVAVRINDIDRYGYDVDGESEVDGGQDGPKHPKTAAFFLQDKFEREGVIVNGGLRFDYINVDTPALISETFPLGDPGDPQDSTLSTLDPRDLAPNKKYTRISPRFGVAFPVTEKTLLRVNYGQFFQQVNLQDLYVSYRFLEYKINNGGYFVGFGNPNLKPERTTAYEVGVAHQLGERMRLDVTAYYKDVKDLVEVQAIRSNPAGFSSYRNRDFATLKGLDIGWSMRPINHISASVNYSLSYAQGTGSVSNTQRNIAWTADRPPKQTSPLDFDQRHKLTLNADYRLGAGEGPGRLFSNTGLNVLVRLSSGTPYTPIQVQDEVTLGAISRIPTGPLNSRYGPWTSTIDAKLSKGFQFGSLGLEGFLWVLNVLDRKNAQTVFESSGSAFTTNWLNTQAGQAFLAQQGEKGRRAYELAQNRPTFFSNPRLVRFGLRASF